MTEQKKKRPNTLQLMDWQGAELGAYQRQYLFLAGFLGLVFLVFVLRLWHLQVIRGSEFRYDSENNRIRLEDIPAPRGLIFDRHGNPLVENRPAYHLMLVPEDAEDSMDETLARLAGLCERSPDRLREILREKRHLPDFVPIRLVADMDRDCLARVEAQRLRLPGVSLQVEPKREYKYNGTAAHLIGYMSEITETQLSSEAYADYMAGESVGKVGVERAFEKYLHGRRGGRQVEVDASGRHIRLLNERPPQAGLNLWLTIDISLQKEVEACLEDKRGAIVALDPRDGAILAMASSPSFDQEQFIRGLSREQWRALRQNPAHPLLNRATASAYPPGSTYKPLVALAALQEGVVDTKKTVWCPGYLHFGNRNYRCWRDIGHGHMNVYDAIVQSCDVFFYQTGLKLGVDRIAAYAKAFGLGTPPGLEMDHEAAGLIPTSEWKKRATGVPWQKGETLSIAIGQGFNLATPLQMAVAYAALANGGTVWRPYVVGRVEGNADASSPVYGPEILGKVPVDARHFKVVQDALTGVVSERRGTAHRIAHERVEIAGKTGTAQVVRMAENINRKQWEKNAADEERDHAWFVCYAPAKDPSIVVAVLVEHGGHGSSIAAPLARRVVLSYLGIEPEETAEAGSSG